MQIDYVAIVKALKEIGYSGYLTLEADRYPTDFNESNVEECVKNMLNSALQIDKLFTKI